MSYLPCVMSLYCHSGCLLVPFCSLKAVAVFSTNRFMPKPRMGMWFNRHILHRKLLPSRPPHNCLRYFYVQFIRKRDGQREGFAWSHGQITGESPTGAREIPHGALALKWPSVIRNGALHREATVGANREGHGHLAGWRIVGWH